MENAGYSITNHYQSGAATQFSNQIHLDQCVFRSCMELPSPYHFFHYAVYWPHWGPSLRDSCGWCVLIILWNRGLPGAHRSPSLPIIEPVVMERQEQRLWDRRTETTGVWTVWWFVEGLTCDPTSSSGLFCFLLFHLTTNPGRQQLSSRLNFLSTEMPFHSRVLFSSWISSFGFISSKMVPCCWNDPTGWALQKNASVNECVCFQKQSGGATQCCEC